VATSHDLASVGRKVKSLTAAPLESARLPPNAPPKGSLTISVNGLIKMGESGGKIPQNPY